MCLIVFAWQQHPRWPLVLLAHRDEFRARPSAALHWWDQPDMLAGRDLQAGGTWFGVHRQGRFAALTNVRRHPAPPAARSRGDWVPAALQSPDIRPQLTAGAAATGAFNLLWGDQRRLWAFHSPDQSTLALEPGVHALSNARINTDWPKVRATRARLHALLMRNAELDERALWNVGALSALEVDATELPATGLSPEWERRLAPPLILGADYGTVSRSQLWMGTDRTVRVVEQQLDPHGQVQAEQRMEWQLDPGAERAG